MPSTTSSEVDIDLASSTVMTPSLPTFSIASAIRSPIVGSLFAEIVPTWAISFLPAVGLLMALELRDDDLDGLLDAALHVHRVGAGRDVLGALAEDRLGQDRRRRRAVAGDVARLAGDFADHLGAHVLISVLQLDLLGHRHAVLRDRGGAELLVDDDVPALGAEGRLDRAGELVHAPEHRPARLVVEYHLLSHSEPPLWSIRLREPDRTTPRKGMPRNSVIPRKCRECLPLSRSNTRRYRRRSWIPNTCRKGSCRPP